jgi:hypothetical protein
VKKLALLIALLPFAAHAQQRIVSSNENEGITVAGSDVVIEDDSTIGHLIDQHTIRHADGHFDTYSVLEGECSPDYPTPVCIPDGSSGSAVLSYSPNSYSPD